MSLTDAQYDRTRDLVDGLVDVWKEPRRLRNWGLRCYWYRSTQDFLEAAPEGATKETRGMCQAQWEYLWANLYFNIERMFMFDDREDWERTVVHELVHCVVDELYRSAAANDDNSPFEKQTWSQHNERVVTELADAFYMAYHRPPVAGEY